MVFGCLFNLSSLQLEVAMYMYQPVTSLFVPTEQSDYLFDIGNQGLKSDVIGVAFTWLFYFTFIHALYYIVGISSNTTSPIDGRKRALITFRINWRVLTFTSPRRPFRSIRSCLCWATLC